MHEIFGGPLKLIFNEKRLSQLYGDLHEQMSAMQVSNHVWKGAALKGGMVYERDTTEQMNFGFTFSKKGKIIGVGSSSPKYKCSIQEARIPVQRDFERIDSLVSHKHLAAGFSGCVAVFDHDSVVYENCFGRCSYPNGQELVPSNGAYKAQRSKCLEWCWLISYNAMHVARAVVINYFPIQIAIN